MKKNLLFLLLAIIGLLFPKPNFGQAPALGAASSFAFFTSTGALTNLGPTQITGDIGTNAGPLAGFPPGVVIGAIHIEDAVTLQASIDLGLAYGYLSTLGGAVLGITMTSGQIITPGIYFTGAASTIDGNLILDGQGDPDALFIIRIGGALATGTYASISLINGASLNNVYWQVMGQFDLGDYSVFRGIVIADGAINLLEGSSLFGQALSVAGAIALHGNILMAGIPPDGETGADRAVCLNESTQIGSTPVPGNTYSWVSAPSGFTSTEANPTVTPLETTIYTLTETVTLTNISTTNSVEVTVNPLPAAVAGMDRAICLNESTQIGAEAVIGSTYSWSSVPPGFTSLEANPIVTPLVNTTYTVVETITATGCTNENSVNVTVNAPPAAVAGLDREICLNETTMIGAVAVVGSTYSWSSVPPGFSSLEANPIVTPLVNTTYTVVETITTTGCNNDNSVVVTVNASPAAVAGMDRAICLNESTQIGAPAVIGNTYSWSSVPAGFTSLEANPIVTPLVYTTYTLVETVTVTTCSNSNSVAVSVHPQPAAVAGMDRAICLNESTQIGAEAVIGSTYSWSSVPAGFTSMEANPIVAPLVNTTYTVIETNTETGCSNDNSVNVTTNDTPEAFTGTDRTICLNSSTQIGAEAVIGNTYSWSSVPAGFTSMEANPIVTPLVNTTYTLVETVTATSCSNSNSVAVSVNPLPAAIAGMDRAICLSESTQLGAEAVIGSTYRWTSVPTGLLTYQSNPTVSPIVTTTYKVVETIEGTGCSNTNFVTVTVNNLPLVNAGPDAFMHESNTYTLSGSSATNAASMRWTTSGTGTFDDASVLHPVYTPGSSDIMNRSVTLTLTATPASPCSEVSDAMVLTIIGEAGLLVTKKALETGYSAVGNVIHFTINVTNISPVTITNIMVVDANAVITGGNPISSLAPGKSAVINATHTITQQDIDAGQVINCASASGLYPDVLAVSASSECVTVPGLQRPQITITKFVTEPLFRNVGETIHYTFEIFNCGNVSINNIVISDPSAVITAGNPISSLAPRTTVTASGEHRVTQSDVNAGRIVNVASVSGVGPLGNPVTDESNEVTLFANIPATLLVTQSAREASFNTKGDTLHFDIILRNYRNSPVMDIMVTDPNAIISSSNKLAIMNAGNSATFLARHIVTQSDLDAGKVVNIAYATGTDFYNFVDNAISNEVTVFAAQSPLLVLTKTAQEESYSAIGELIHYSNEVRNTGNVKITGLTLTDPNTSATGSKQIASLEPGESAIIGTIHTITLADLNIGFVEKTASISGADANSQPVRMISNQVTVKGKQNAQLTSLLTSAENTFAMEGDLIHYSIEVRNSGNVSLTNVSITDETSGPAIGKSIPVLVPGTVTVFNIEHTITPADMLAGKVLNRATVSAYNQVGEKISRQSNELSVTASTTERLIVTKFVQESSFTKAGEIIHYTVTIRNNGKVSLSDISVLVPGAVISGNSLISNLSASSSSTINATRTITQADLDAGTISSIATISGTYQDGTAYSEQSNPVLVNGIQEPGLKTALSAAEPSFDKVGQLVNFTITMENTGNVTLTSIGLTNQGDLSLAGQSDIRLAPGETIRISVPYVVAVSDMDAGAVVKTVYASGIDSRNQPIDAMSDEVIVTGLQKPELSARATSAERNFNKAGDIIHYTINVRNSGNVSIISTAVTNPNAVIIDARPITILLPGESFTVSATHIITEADLLAGKVVCASKAEGFDLKGNTILKVSNKITVSYMQTAELEIVAGSSQLNSSKIIEVKTSVKGENFNLSNYPNPFTNETTISFDLPENGKVILKVYDLTGREVGHVDQTEFNQGNNQVIWKSNTIQKGLYFLKLIYNGNQANRTMSIIN